MNLTDANLKKRTQFQLNYKASQFFNLPRLSLDGWVQSLKKMHSDDTFWNKFWKQVWNGYFPVSDCFGVCKKNILCEIESATQTSMNKCKQLNLLK